MSMPIQNSSLARCQPLHSQTLDWNQRPSNVRDSINSAFDRLVKQDSSSWGWYNGSQKYYMCGIDEHVLLKTLIKQAPPGKKEFNVLEIGAGNFQWVQNLAAFLDKQTDLPKDIKINIIGIRGESYFGNRLIETDRCKIYSLGAFKVEEIFSQLKEKGFDLENKADLAITRWCFRHLADPVGTFQQTYQLLRPESGFFLLDGFYFLTNENHLDEVKSHDRKMTRLILDTKAPFLTLRVNDGHALNHFVLKRLDDGKCNIPMSYENFSVHGGSRSYQIGSSHVTCFKRLSQEEDSENFTEPDFGDHFSDRLYGNKNLFDFMKKNRIFIMPGSTWYPLQEKDNSRMVPPLHQAVLNEDITAIKKCLSRGDDIDETDSFGNSSLHLSIQKKNLDIFQLLLQSNPDLESENQYNITALNEASVIDTSGEFLQALLARNANIDSKSSSGKTPLQRAISAKNIRAVEILIQAGANISQSDYELLDNKEFSSLHERNIIPLKIIHTIGALPNILSWIQSGHCVVLHNNGNNAMMFHDSKLTNKHPELIYFNIYPYKELLMEGEWPSILNDEGYKPTPCDVKKIEHSGFKRINHLNYELGR